MGSLSEISGSLNTLTWSPSGETLSVGTGEGTVYLLKAKNGTTFKIIEKGYTVNSLAFSPNEKELAVGFDDRHVQIISINGTVVKNLVGIGYGSTSVTYSPEGSLFAASINDSKDYSKDNIQIWNTNDWNLDNVISIGESKDFRITGFDQSPEGQILAISIVDQTGQYQEEKIQIVKVNDGSVVKTLELTGSKNRIFIKSLSFSPDGNKLLSLSEEGEYLVSEGRYSKLRIWDVSDWGLAEDIKIPIDYKKKGSAFDIPNAVAWSSDGTVLALGMPDGTIQLRKSTDGELLQTLSGHSMWVTGVAFSPDNKCIASISLDGTVRIWGVR